MYKPIIFKNFTTVAKLFFSVERIQYHDNLYFACSRGTRKSKYQFDVILNEFISFIDD